MRPEEWKKIRSCWERLVEELDLPHGIIDRLYANGVLSDLDKCKLSAEKIDREKNQTFLEILRKKPDTAYVQFTEALKIYQPALLQILQPPGRPQSKRGCCDGQGLLLFLLLDY